MIDLASAKERYGEIVNGIWKQESRWCVILNVPYEVAIKLVNTATKQPTFKIYCNRDIADPLNRAFQNVLVRGFLNELSSYDGCLNIRNIRGVSDVPSTHSYALAIDINAAENKLGTDGWISDKLAKCFTDEGFIWGKTFKRKDPMHFQIAAW